MRAAGWWHRGVVVMASLAGLAAASTEASADRLALPGSHLHYEVHGDGRPVVLIHGGNLDAGMWDADVPVLAKRFRVITYDVRPYGRSGPATAGYAWHEDLRALLDHLKIGRADLVGLSLGARLAINFAIAYPARVDRLVLAGPGLDGWAWSPDPQLAGLIAAATARDAAKATALWLRHPYMAPAMRDPARAATLRRLAARNQHIWLQPLGPDVVPVPPAMSGSSTSRPRPWSRRHARRPRHPAHRRSARTRHPWGAPGRPAGIGHLVNLEAPARFRALVTDFLSNR